MISEEDRTSIDLYRQGKGDPQLKSQMADLNHLALEERIRKITASPTLATARRAHEISPRDYVMTGAALGPAMAVAKLVDSGEKGPGASLENQMFWPAAPPDHVSFYRSHSAEIDKLVDDMIKIIQTK